MSQKLTGDHFLTHFHTSTHTHTHTGCLLTTGLGEIYGPLASLGGFFF